MLRKQAHGTEGRYKVDPEAYEEISVSPVGSDRCSSCFLWLDLEAPFLLPYHISLHNP